MPQSKLFIKVLYISFLIISSFGIMAQDTLTTCICPELIDSTMMCTSLFEPVCGCDGRTYPNACNAKYYGGQKMWVDGDCGSCASAPLRRIWLREVVTRALEGDCSGGEVYRDFSTANHNGMNIVVAKTNTDLDTFRTDVFDCFGQLLQSCTSVNNQIESCSLNGNIDVSSLNENFFFNTCLSMLSPLPIVPASCEGGLGVMNDTCACIVIGSIEIEAWNDSQADGILNNGDECAEQRIEEGISFQLLDRNGNPAVKLDGSLIEFAHIGNGFWKADEVLPDSNYSIQVISGDWIISLPHYDGSTTDILDGEDDSDFDPNSGMSVPFTISHGERKTNIDIALFKTMEIGGVVWVQFDDSNGIYDGPPEEGLVEDIIMRLHQDTDGNNDFETVIGETHTDSDGSYSFKNLHPGEYMVEAIQENFNQGTQLQVFQCTPQNFGLNDTEGTNDCVGPMETSTGGAEAASILMRSGCEVNGGYINSTVDFGFYDKFECSINDPDYLAFNCENTDPNSSAYNPFWPICDVKILGYFCSRLPTVNTGNGPIPLCNNGGHPENIHWFSFIAGFGNYAIKVSSGNCTDANGNPPGTGIQNGIYSDCSFSTQIGPCIGVPCSQSPIELGNINPITGEQILIPGNTYYWFLDGCNGSICDFVIEVTGTFIPYEPECPTSIECSPLQGSQDCSSELVAGTEARFTLQGSGEKAWDFMWSITPETGWEVVSQVPDPSAPLKTKTNNIQLSFEEEGSYLVCWESFSAKCYWKRRQENCNNDPALCKEIIVSSCVDEDFGTFELCQWEMDIYNGPTQDENGNPDPNGDGLEGWQTFLSFWTEGIYEFNVIGADGCTYTETVELLRKPVSEKIRVDTVFCLDSLELFGFTFIQNDTLLDLNLRPSIPAENGCDSIIDLFIWWANFQGQLQAACVENIDNNLLYELVFDLDTNSIGETSTLTSYVYNWYHVESGTGPGDQVVDGDPDSDPSTLQSTLEGEWELRVTAQVDDPTVGRLGSCDFSFFVNTDTIIEDLSNIAIQVDQTEVCHGDTVTLDLMGNISDNIASFWRLAGQVVNGADVMGRGPFVIELDSSGSFEIVLELDPGACPVTYIRDTIDVLPMPAPPQVICAIIDTNFIEFMWNSVIDASSYQVEILNSGQNPITTNDTSIIIDGLLPNTEVQIRVTAEINTVCGNVGSEIISCTTLMLVGNHDQYLREVKIIPNPALNYIEIQSDLSLEGPFEIMDINGKSLVKSHKKRIDISTLKAGTYVVHGSQFVHRFVKLD